MLPKELFTIGLRLLAIAQAVTAISQLVQSTPLFVQLFNMSQGGSGSQFISGMAFGGRSVVLGTLGGPAVTGVAACLIWLYAGAIARVVYGPSSRDSGTVSLNVSARDLCRIGIGLLGVYSMVLAMPSIATIWTLVASDMPPGNRTMLIGYVLQPLVHIAAGVALVVYADKLARKLNPIEPGADASIKE